MLRIIAKPEYYHTSIISKDEYIEENIKGNGERTYNNPPTNRRGRRRRRRRVLCATPADAAGTEDHISSFFVGTGGCSCGGGGAGGGGSRRRSGSGGGGGGSSRIRGARGRETNHHVGDVREGEEGQLLGHFCDGVIDQRGESRGEGGE